MSNRILSIDVGGSGVKATLVSGAGKAVSARHRIETPFPCPPFTLLSVIRQLAHRLPGYNKVAIGFPGYVKRGIVYTAPNLDPRRWSGFPLSKRVEKMLKKPVRLVNDADLQGLAARSGRGLELVVTLGTGFGTAYFLDGRLMPHLEVSSHPVKKGVLWDDYIGDKTRKRIGKKKWNRRVRRMIQIMKAVFNCDTLIIGGGNAKRINFKLPKGVRIVSNKDAAKGGAALWKEKGAPHAS